LQHRLGRATTAFQYSLLDQVAHTCVRFVDESGTRRPRVLPHCPILAWRCWRTGHEKRVQLALADVEGVARADYADAQVGEWGGDAVRALDGACIRWSGSELADGTN
jgi:hypothetical protein